MKRIGISQRVDSVPGRDERRDALDIRWAKLLWSLGYLPVMLSSGITDVSEYLEVMQLDGFILSGGNDIGSVEERDRLEWNILEYSRVHYLPVLGVCRGMQFINFFLGGQLKEVSGHVAQRHLLTLDRLNLANKGEVNSYHNYAILEEGLGQQLKVLAACADGVIEAIKHNDLPWLGIMWHPEREEPFLEVDKNLIKKHFS